MTRLLLDFHAIDINSTGVVSTDDLTAVLVVSSLVWPYWIVLLYQKLTLPLPTRCPNFSAFSQVLCNGTSSHKLRFLFEVFGTLGKDGLTRRQFWRYTRSILTALVQLSSEGSALNPSDARHALNAASIYVSSLAFGAREASTSSETDERIMFDEWEPSVGSIDRLTSNLELEWVNCWMEKPGQKMLTPCSENYSSFRSSPNGSGSEEELECFSDDTSNQGSTAAATGH